MARVVLINMILFLLPFFGYALVQARRDPAGWRGDFWEHVPLFRLGLLGAAMVLAMLVLFVHLTGDLPGDYKPATYKDGKVEQGHIEPKATP